ncbi:MAG: beta-propeller fold lactonase family protein [Candidatus Eisenbacteria bacterium]|nr:beta-propeller fold lactonase family protein [Candidatus Latescibacterota bacterium]MBD3301811.1 beta-propeller fold lactonase family protein [Candidatus Eisenbacteria bacterium]
MKSMLVALALLSSSLAFASTPSLDPTGQPFFEVETVERGMTFGDLAGRSGRDYGATDLDPGLDPEGDYLGTVAFTNDGDRVLCTNTATDNVTVFDAQTRQVLTNVDVGRYPHGIGITDEYAIIACAFSDEVWVIDLDDYAVAAVVPTGEQPWVVRTDPTGRYAYVSCDIENTCEKIDLTSMSTVLVIPDFPVFLLSFGFTSENGRNYVRFTNFELVNGGSEILVGDWDGSARFYDTTTGALTHTIGGIPDCVAVALSGDATTAVVSSATSPMAVHRIDLAGHALANSVTISGKTFSINYIAGVDPTGAKAFVSVSGNQSAFVRFATSDYTLLSSTYTPFWIGTSPDHTLAVGGQYRYSILDFASETLVGQHQGNAQYLGAVSPVENRTASISPMLHEGVYFYEFPTGPPSYLGTTNSGLDPEGDAPRRVAITPDGSKAVITNVLSDNATILDLSTYEIETFLHIGDRVQDVAITSDSRWAVVCGFETHSVKIVDLDANAVVADVPCGLRAGVVALSPDDAYAYVGNIQGNTVSVVELDGAASQNVGTIPCGVIGVSWAAYGVSSDVEMSPTGEYVLVAASFDDQVKVIDTATNTVVATLDVGNFPLQIAFEATGEYAMVTNYQHGSVSILHVDGASSSVVGTYARGGGPLRLAYDPIHDEMGVCNYSSQTLVRLDPRTGALLGTTSFAAYGPPLQVRYDENGEAIVLTGSGSSDPHLHRGGDAIPLPAAPSYFDYVPLTGRSVTVMPGPDWATLAVLEAAGIEEAIPVPVVGALEIPWPHPVTGETRIGFRLPRAGEATIDLLDAAGRRVERIRAGFRGAGEHAVVWNGSGLVSGVYFAVLRIDGSPLETRKVQVIGGSR